MYKQYGDVAQFFVVYIKEAHPSDDTPHPVNARLKYIKDPASLFERFQVASTCVADLNLSIPCLVDDMENTTARAYKAHPDRIYVVGKDGKIAFHGGPGPYGFSPRQMEQFLVKELVRIAALPSASKRDEGVSTFNAR